MRVPHSISVRAGPILLAAFMTVLAVANALAGQESTIFTFDGKDFIRQHTTLLTENGKPAHQSAGVKFLRQEKDRAVFAVESGEYEFESKGP